MPVFKARHPQSIRDWRKAQWKKEPIVGKKSAYRVNGLNYNLFDVRCQFACESESEVVEIHSFLGSRGEDACETSTTSSEPRRSTSVIILPVLDLKACYDATA